MFRLMEMKSMNEIGYMGGVGSMPYHSHGDDHDHHEYLEHHHMCDYAKKSDCASKATAGAGLGLGIAGTVLGGLAFLGRGGRRGGWFGGCDEGFRDEYGHGDRHQRHYEIRQAERISELQAGLAQQSAERFTEQKVFGVYRDLETRMDVRFGALEKQMCECCCKLAVAEATTAAKLAALQEMAIEGNKNLKEQFKDAFRLEAEKRECGDRELREWVLAHYVMGEMVMPKHKICPPVMERFNAFKCPKECCECEHKD